MAEEPDCDPCSSLHVYDLKWLVVVLEVVLEGQLGHILRKNITKEEVANLSVPKYTTSSMSKSLDRFCDESNILVEVTKPPIVQAEQTLDPMGVLALCAWCKLFPVMKKNGTWRAIFDSWNGAKMCLPPLPVHFCRMHVLVGIMAKYRLHWCCDLAHWFYAIPVAADNPITNLFHVQSHGRGNRCFKVASLPQGFSHSPRFAQCIAWGVVLYHQEKEQPLFRMDLVSTEEPPEFLELHRAEKVSGAVCVWIDSIAISCDDFNQMTRVITRIKANADYLSIRFSDPVDWDAPNAATPRNRIEYIGIVSDYDSKRGIRVWRHLDKKYRKLEELYQYLQDTHNGQPSFSPG